MRRLLAIFVAIFWVGCASVFGQGRLLVPESVVVESLVVGTATDRVVESSVLSGSVLGGGFAAPLFDSIDRPKVAVVLSGGGAKGVAHIGALRVIEEAGVPIDIIVGTSMGAIVGGLYSIGYTPAQLDSMVMAQDWSLLLSDQTPRRHQMFSNREFEDNYQISYSFGERMEGIGGMIRGTNLGMLFGDLTAGYHGEVDFSSLPIPFACVAANIVDGSERVLDHGVLSEAMRASMAIPGVFTPVYTGDAVLVDGGIVNNYPVDVALAMGADIVIGVDVQAVLRGKENLLAAQDVLGQIVEMTMQQGKYRENVENTDVYIRVDVEGYSASSFNLPALDTLMMRGRAAARGRFEELAAVSAVAGPATVAREGYTPLSGRGGLRIYNISFEGLSERQARWIMRKCRVRENSWIDTDKLGHCVSVLSNATSHSGVHYALRDTLGGYNLDFFMDEVKGNSLSAGVSFDSEEIAAVLVNGTLRLGRKNTHSVVSLTGRFGKRLVARLDYSLLTSPLSNFKLSLGFDRDNIIINSRGKREFNPLFYRQNVGFSYINTNFLRQNLRMELGAEYEYFHYRSWLTGHGNEIPSLGDDGLNATGDREEFFNYFARVDYESLDSRYFTRRGTAISLGAEVVTDNGYRYKGFSPLLALSASWSTAIPFSPRFSIIPGMYGRVVSGTSIPFPKQNMIGGRIFGRYMPQQMPFDGIGYVEAAPNAFVAARLQARQRVLRRNYVSASFNYGVGGNWFFDVPVENRNYFGASIDWGYDLRNFPLVVSLSWSNITHSVGFYFQAGYSF